jgi:hypothetical protein
MGVLTLIISKEEYKFKLNAKRVIPDDQADDFAKSNDTFFGDLANNMAKPEDDPRNMQHLKYLGSVVGPMGADRVKILK